MSVSSIEPDEVFSIGFTNPKKKIDNLKLLKLCFVKFS
jgi:hypothetical protein